MSQHVPQYMVRSDAGNVTIGLGESPQSITFRCTLPEAAALCCELLRVLVESGYIEEMFQKAADKSGEGSKDEGAVSTP